MPAVWIMFTTDSLVTYYLVSPVAQLFSSAWVGAAVATLQDVVLPRMRATAGATYVLGTTMIGLALGPYFAGAVSEATHSLSAGVFSLYVVPPFTLLALWLGSRRIADLEATKVERARAAGEPV
jgi:MFS family permease